MEKIIMLDIDGVLLPKKSYLIENNINAVQKLREKENYFRNNRNEIDNVIEYSSSMFEEYAKTVEFDKNAINLVNRLAEKSNAKIVILSNWRRRLNGDELVEVLVEKGIKREHFHSNHTAPMKMTSEKIHDLYMWIDKQELPEDNYKIVVLDDEYISSDLKYKNNILLVNTHFDEGFTVSEYRIAAGFLGIEDPMFSVVQLTEEELLFVKEYIGNNDDLYDFLYSTKTVSGGLNSRANYFSFKEAERIINEEGSYFSALGYGLGTVEKLYKTRKESVLKDLEKEYGESKKITDRILTGGLKEIERFKISSGDFEKHPKQYPALILGDGENGFEYIYAPEKCREPIEYLNGYYKSLTQFDEHK